MKKRKIGIGYRNLKRYKKIADILVKYGFGYFVERLNHRGAFPKWIFKKSVQDSNLTVGERFRLTLEELGPTFIKLGQILSTRPDIASEEIIFELAKLQDCAIEFPIEVVEATVESELGLNLYRAFNSFSKNPIAAASIGQVHTAKLLTGENVVVKIQRPNIKNIITTDINILTHMASIFDEYYKGEIPFKMVEIVDEFSNSITRELDYTVEARNAEKFRENFKEDRSVQIPKVYWDLTSKKILTMESIAGIKVANIEALKERGWDTKRIADLIATSFMKQVFIYGLFHGDPHPGNIFILDEKKIAFIDFGIVGYLDRETMNFITDLFIAGAKRDIEKIVHLLIEIDAISEETNVRRLKEDISYVLNLYYNTPLKRLKMSEAVTELMGIAYHNSVKLPLQFTVLAKAIITLEGCVKILNPDFSVSDIAGKFVHEITSHRLSPHQLVGNTLNYIEDIFSSMQSFPKYVKNILKRLEKNEIQIRIEQSEVESLTWQLKETGIRISISLITAALLIASSNLMAGAEKIKWVQTSLLGLFGYAFALGLLFFIILNISYDKIHKKK
ncbi:MAG: AarF/ABC1/UbiB kinase family protein [Thermotaleaceae bacterium]